MRALLRRPAVLRPQVMRVGRPRAQHRQATRVARGGKSVSLTAKEYALLEFLVFNEGRVVGREQIAQHVWDESFDPFLQRD